MKSDIEKIYLIDRFLKGELSGLTLDEFKSRLRTDKEFAEEVESQRAIIEGIKLARRQHLISILNGQKAPEMNLVNEESTENSYKNADSEPEMNVAQGETVTKEKTLGREYKLRPNYNNWAYAAVAVLFAGFVYYAIFGYYIPHKRLEMANTDTSKTKLSPTENNITVPSDEEPELVENPNKKDTSETQDIKDPLMASAGDSLKVEKDKKISETVHSVSAFETIPEGEANDQNVSNGGNSDNLKLSIRKVRGSTIKVEYWQSVVNFKGYKLNGSNLQLFEIKPEESVSFKYLDKQLYLKKSGNYYKINASGNFEQYQKENDTEVIKKLDSN